MKRPLLLLCALVALLVGVACTKPPAPNDDAGVAHHKYGDFGPQPSPLCLVQDGSGAFVAAQPSGVNVGAGDTITVKLASTAGVRSWSLSAYGEDELTTTSVPALTFAFGPPSTYSFTYPNATGRALLLKSVVNGGIDINGQYQPSYVTTIGLWSVIGGQRVLATGETYESNPAGWIADINVALRSTGSIGGGPTVVGVTASGALAPTAGAWTVYRVNLASGSISVSLPSSGLTETTRVSFALSGPIPTGNTLTITSAGYPMLIPQGANAGTLQNTFLHQYPGATFDFMLLNDSTDGLSFY